MATTRVYILAKELGVKSGAIVSKCQDEGLDIKNHMSTISAGLAATIKEWFSEGENVTTVETGEKVDLEKARIKRKEKAKREKELAEKAEEAEQEQPEQQPALSREVFEEQLAEQAVAAEAAKTAQPEEAETAEQPQDEKEATEPQLEEEPEEVTQPEVVSEESKEEPAKAEEKPEEEKPEPIMPAGPMLGKPKPAVLSGPQVVRIEKAEDIRPRRRPSQPRTFERTPAVPLMEPTGAPAPAKGKKSKRGKGAGGAADEKGRKYRDRDLEERKARLSAATGKGMRARPSRRISKKGEQQQQQQIQRPEKVSVSEPITVKDLASALMVKTGDIIGKLMQQGVMATANQTISTEVAEMVSLELGTELIVEKKVTMIEQVREEFENRPKENLAKRSPIVAMLGHVDHGKTSLLDKIRVASVAEGEAGGITQHIGAYQVTLGGKTVTFLDTPGHEAFTAMRARGANMTDVVVLVVAADDGIMPQTKEAIYHAKAAGVEIIVALNKSDLPGCDYNRIFAQLAEHELTPTEWGGDTEIVKTSAITGMGIEELLEYLEYRADLLELKADNTIPATGWVVEANMSTTRGPTATLLVKEGLFKKGDVILAGSAFGRIKHMKNSFGKTVKEASSGMPVEIIGLTDVPQAGDRFYCLDDLNKAKQIAEELKHMERESVLAKRTQVTLDNLFSQIEKGNVKELNLIIRADVQGSVDVLKKYLSDLSTDEVRIKILHAAPGGISEGDLVLAEASNAIIIGFNVVADEHVQKEGDAKGIDIRFYNIIYRITEDLKKSMSGLLEPEEKEQHLGRLTVRNTFKVSRLGTIAGCYVTDGIIKKKAKLRLIRDNIVVRDNLKIDSLKHFKDDVREVKAGLECGIKVEKFDDIKVDDQFEAFEVVKIARTIE